MEDNAAPKEENPYPKIAKSIFYTAVISGAITGIFLIGLFPSVFQLLFK